MNYLPLSLRIITDTVTITALVMIALFSLLEALGRKPEDRDPLMRYFAGFAFSLAGYVFFDNSLSLLVFDRSFSAKINTIGVASCSFLILLSYLLLLARILGMPRDRRGWMIACVIPALAAYSLCPFVVVYGWEWYMAHLDVPAIVLYSFVFLFGTAKVIAFFVRNRLYRSRMVSLLLASSLLMILSLFFYRILIAVNTANYLFNNSIILGGMSFLFPIFLSLRRSEEYLELQRFRIAREEESMRKSLCLRTVLRSDPSIRNQPGLREIDVCEALLGGLEYKEIADGLGLSLSGVKKRVHSLYGKLGVQNRTELYNRVHFLRDGSDTGRDAAVEGGKDKDE